MAKTKLTRYLVSYAFLLVLVFHASGSMNMPLLDNLNRQAYDFLLKLSLQNDEDPRIVIIDIDDKSLQSVGHWPWGRNVLADMLDVSFDHYNISVLGFDVLFAERDDSSGLDTLDELAQKELKNNEEYQKILKEIRPSLEYDQRFADAIKDRNVVLGYFFQRDQKIVGNPTIGALPDPAVLLDDELSLIPFPEARGAGGNLELFQSNANHGGFIDLPIIDDDGVIRSIPMFQRFGDVLYEALSLAMVRTLMDFPYLELKVEGEAQGQIHVGLEKVEFEGFSIPVDERSAALIPYRGTSGSFPYVSAVDVLNKTVPMEIMEGAIVLVGTTAAGLLDLRSTPVQGLYPGVEVHANLIAGILDGSIKQNPAFIAGASMISLIIIWVLTSIITINQNMILFTAATLTLITSIIGGVYYAWAEAHIVLPIASQLILIGFIIVHQMTFSYFVENKSKRQLAKVFGQYIPRELVNELGNQEEEYAIGGELREMTVMFSDIRGFTAISENMEPKDLTQMMNAYFTSMTEAIQNHRGTIDKYIGDAIMAFWGAPIHDPKHAEQALEATLDMVHRLDELEILFKEKGWPKIAIGCGINTGPMYVGNIGSEFRKSYTVLGDSVNLGSRVEALTKKYGVSIIVTESTRAVCPNHSYRELDCVRVVGKNEPVAIYEPVGLTANLSDEQTQELSEYHEALHLHRNQNWDETITRFKALLEKDDRLIYQEYINRSENYKTNPPDSDWDGVYTHSSK